MNKQDTKKIMILQTIWFTFLVVSLVACFFACIILGINSKNVAHAEEPIRSALQYTFVRDSYVDGYFLDGHQLVFSNSLQVGKWFISGNGSVTPSSNGLLVSFSGEGYLIFGVDLSSLTSVTNTIAQGSYNGMSPSFQLCSYNYGAVDTLLDHGSCVSNFNRVNYYNISKQVSTGVCGFGFHCSNTASATFTFLKVETGSYFTGQPKNNFSPNGYDIGYRDGVNSVDGSPDYELISSSGIVNNNMLPNNEISSWTYSLDNSVHQRQERSLRSTSYFYDDGTWTYNLVDGSLQNNVFSGSNAAITFDSTDEPEQNYSAGYYTVTLGYSAFSGNVSLYFATNLMHNSIEVPLDATKSFVSLTLSPSTSFVQFDIELIITGSGSVSLNFIKLERGQYFSGYVPKAYSYYGYNDGVEDGTTTVLPSDSYNFVGSILTLGTIQEFTYNGNTYVGYAAEEDSFTDTSGVRYQATYYDTQGDDSGTLLGLCVDYLFKYSVIVRTICYGTSARWERVGFNIIAIDTVDNSSYTLSRYDTSYYTEFGSLGADGTNGTYVSAEFKFSFPNNHEYRLLFVPVNHNLVDNRTLVDNATMLIFENTYFLSQANGSLSYDDYNYLIDDAYNRGLIQGRTNGYDSGYSSGYSVGYNIGTDDAGNYTFASLFGAVFDAPITAIVGKYDSVSGTRIGGLLNFNVLGVNISGFVLALLSIGVVLFILRIFLRGV